ncbi:MAG: hypothetical protein QMC24_07110 [Akkermansiaceae bacterium]
MRLLLVPLLFLCSCIAHIDLPRPAPNLPKTSLNWPSWNPIALAESKKEKRIPNFPETHHTPAGPVTTYGPDKEGGEEFMIGSRRGARRHRAPQYAVFPHFDTRGEKPLQIEIQQTPRPEQRLLVLQRLSLPQHFFRNVPRHHSRE